MPQSKIEAIVEANRIRKEFAAGVMLQMGWEHMYAGKGNPVLGVRCLLMELSSDSLRVSSIQGIMKRVKAKNCPWWLMSPRWTRGICLSGIREEGGTRLIRFNHSLF